MPNVNPTIIDEFGGASAYESIQTDTYTNISTVTLDDSIVTSNTGGSQTHSTTDYKVKSFTPEKVAGISVGIVTNSDGDKAYGTGLCRKVASDKYELIVNGKSFLYNSKGEGISSNSVGTKLKLGETTPTQQKTILALNARDEFAMHILGELLKGVPDPSLLGTTEMAYYTKLAYTWSAYMMDAASEGRVADTGTVASTYNNNTEALLGQIATNILSAGSASGNSQASAFNGAITSMPTVKVKTDTNDNVAVSGTISIGNSGLGRNSSNPIYVSGMGVYPSKSAVSSQYYSDATSGTTFKVTDFLAFNNGGALGYITLKEAQKVILGWMSQAGDGNVSSVGDVLSKSDFIDSLLDTATAQTKLAGYVKEESNFISTVKGWIIDLIQDTTVSFSSGGSTVYCTVTAPSID